MPSDALVVLGEVADVLERLGLRYAVGGSLASGAWSEPRSTHDVDVLLDLSAQRIPELHAALRDRFYVDEGSMRTAVQDRRAFNVIHLGLYQKVDLFVAGSGALDTAQLEGPVLRRLSRDSERLYPVTAPEIIVLRKLDWYRRTGETSDRQWRDAQAVLRVQGDRLDHARMSSLAEATGLTALLERAVTDAWGGASP
jgi:hypothetical protein